MEIEVTTTVSRTTKRVCDVTPLQGKITKNTKTKTAKQAAAAAAAAQKELSKPVRVKQKKRKTYTKSPERLQKPKKQGTVKSAKIKK